MTENPSEEKHRANLMALTFLLRQMAGQLLEEGQLPEARGFVDMLESLQAKTKGNVGPEEEKLLEGVIFELRMAVIQGKKPEGGEPDGGAGPPDAETPSETESEARKEE